MKSNLIASMIFKIKLNPIPEGTYYFDMTTYVLTRLLLKKLNKQSHVLDMGTGACCIIGLTLWKHLGCKVISSDMNPNLISLAQENIDLNHAQIQLICSNLFQNIKNNFNVVTFNPPYVPTSNGTRNKLSKKFQSQWDGGIDGSLTINQFLNELNELKKAVTVYMGINYRYVPKEKILPLIYSKKDLKLIKIHQHRFLPVQIYIIEKQYIS